MPQTPKVLPMSPVQLLPMSIVYTEQTLVFVIG